MDDELGERRVERVVLERQLLRRRASHVHAGVPLLRRNDERLRRIGGRDALRAQPLDELGRQRARPAADVEHPLPGGDSGEVGEPRREQHRVAAHEPVVRIGGDEEAHPRNVDAT